MAEPALAPTLDFERPVVELERKIDELVRVSGDAPELRPQIQLLETRARELQQKIFAELSPWQKVQLSRHPPARTRSTTSSAWSKDSSSCTAIAASPTTPRSWAGFGTFDGTPVLVLGHQKGRSTKEKVRRNFGQPKPEGYRKALRLMELAARIAPADHLLHRYPGRVSRASTPRSAGRPRRSPRTSRSWRACPCPIVCAVIGEGGSGGALALGVANRILMLEYAIYSVISPEGCASILWRDDGKKPEAAAAMKMTATDLLRLGVVDEIIPEAPGGAHRDHDAGAPRPWAKRCGGTWPSCC